MWLKERGDPEGTNVVFTSEELADDSQEGRERLKGKVEVLQREKEI